MVLNVLSIGTTLPLPLHVHVLYHQEICFECSSSPTEVNVNGNGKPKIDSICFEVFSFVIVEDVGC
jgi:hypothetical protein